MKKIPIQCNDYPGFVSNRILMPMINEAIFCLEQNVATKESIDGIMKQVCLILWDLYNWLILLD